MYLLTDWARRINFDKLREERKRTLQEKMAKHGLDSAVFFRVENIKYASDIHPSFFPAIPIRNAAIVKRGGAYPIGFVAGGNWKHRQVTSYWMDPEKIYPMASQESREQVEKTVPNLRKAFEDLKITGGKVGVDLATLYILDALQTVLPKAEFVDGAECINEAKRIKNEEEIKSLRAASGCVEVGMEVTKGTVEMGKREGEVLGEGMLEMYRLGMQVPQGIPFVASGEENQCPLTRFASDRFLRDGDLVVISFGGYFNGMFAEMKRTISCGKPNAEQKKIYAVVKGAVEKALEVMKPGARSQEVFRKVNEVFQKSGYGAYVFNQPLAHGIGVGGWETPHIAPESPDFALESGMVFSLEPILVVPGVRGGGTVAIGNMVVITATGNEVLTNSAYDEKLVN